MVVAGTTRRGSRRAAGTGSQRIDAAIARPQAAVGNDAGRVMADAGEIEVEFLDRGSTRAAEDEMRSLDRRLAGERIADRPRRWRFPDRAADHD